MAMVGWAALGALGPKVIVQSGTLAELFFYAILVIAVCASVAALVALAEREGRADHVPRGEDDAGYQAEMLRALAYQTQFAESRSRLLGLAQRLEGRASSR